MTDLELQLRALGEELALPPEPDLAAAVAARLGPRRRVPRLVIALALLAAALAVALAVPPARSALLRLFHLKGVTVERVDTLPPAGERELAATLGELMPLREAERRLGFRMLLPPGVQPRHARYLDGLGSVVLEHEGDPVLLSEFRAAGHQLVKKLAGGATRVDHVEVDGHAGLWLTGGPHELLWLGDGPQIRQTPVLVHGNVLLWENGDLTLRLEGRLTREEAIRIAESLR